MLSQFLEDRYALELVGDRADGVGYLLKDRVGDLALFIDAVRRVARGGSALDPEVVQRMVGRRRANSPLDDLTPRERQVIALMAEGRSNQGIADELVVTVAAVERHITSIFGKLGLRAGARGPSARSRRPRVPQARLTEIGRQVGRRQVDLGDEPGRAAALQQAPRRGARVARGEQHARRVGGRSTPWRRRCRRRRAG